MKQTDDIELEDFPDLLNDIKQLPKDSILYTEHVLNIPRYVKFTLGTLGINQSDLASKLDKTEAEISKWLSGKQNITLRTISKLEAALNIDLINPEIRKVINIFKGAEIASSPIYTFPAEGSTLNYNVFVLNSVSSFQSNCFTQATAPIEGAITINIAESLAF